MFIARDYFLEPPRGGAATFAELWVLVELARCRAAAGTFASPHLSLQDNGEGMTSAADRFRKAFPALVPFSSLNVLEPVPADLPLRAGEEISALWSEFAAGVPRRFPTG